MAADDPSGARPGPVVLRIKLRYDDVEAMVQRFAPNVGKSGLFLPTRSIQPLDAEVKFELRLIDDKPVLVGLGRVKATRDPDPANPRAVFGMAIELMRVTRDSRELILKMLERRRQMGLPETAIPMADDIDAARRGDFDARPSEPTSSAVPSVTLQSFESAPVGLPEGVPLMTSPRRQSGPMPVAKVASVEALAPEPPRRKRMAVSELIEAASGPIASVQVTVPGLDDEVDVAAVLSRARALAGGDLDGELEALRESVSTPVAIDIEAASAELARQLGGAAVRRDRSARWAPPPPAVISTEAPEASEGTGHRDPDPPQPEPAEGTGRRDPDLPQPDAPAAAIPEVAVQADSAAHFREGYIRDDEELRAVTPASADRLVTEPTPALPSADDEVDPQALGGEHEVDPGQIADEIHQLDEGDFEEVEHTQIGVEPQPDAFDEHAYATRPSVEEEAALADRLDEQLAAVEADDLGIAAAAAADPGQTYEQSYEGMSLDSALETPDLLLTPSDTPRVPDDDDDIEPMEIEDFEILAEADADDADLLAAHGEHEISNSREMKAVAPPAGTGYDRPSFADFASRLDLDDDAHEQFEERHVHGDDFSHSLGEIDPRILSAGHALAAFEEGSGDRAISDFDEPVFTPIPAADAGDTSYTFAGDLPQQAPIDFDAPHNNQYAPGFIPPDKFDQSDVIEIPQPAPAAREPAMLKSVPGGHDEVDLETALEALDVDLDDLSIPHASTELHREGSSAPRGTPTIRPPASASRPPAPAVSRPVRQTGRNVIARAARETGSGQVAAPAPAAPSGRTQARPQTDDGILIDFDDDE